MKTYSFVALYFPAVATAARVIALGSSYGAGIGLSNPNSPTTGAYGARFANYIGASFTNAAVSGSQLIDIYSGSNAQINAINSSVTHVTITSGGNDLGYSACVIATGNNPSMPVSSCNKPTNPTTALQRYITAVHAIYDRLKAVGAPNPDEIPIYIITYWHLIGAYTKNGTAEVPQSTATLQDIHNMLYEPLRALSFQVYNTLKTNYTVRFIPMGGNSINNAIDATAAAGGPWTNGRTNFSTGAAWHPNQEGHRQVARFVYRDLTGNFPSN